MIRLQPVHPAGRFRLGFPDELRERLVRNEAHEHVDVIGENRLSENMGSGALSGLPDRARHDFSIGASNASRTPPRVPRDVREQTVCSVCRHSAS